MDIMEDMIEYNPLHGFPHRHTLIMLHDENSNAYLFSQRLLTSRLNIPGRPPVSVRAFLDTCRLVFPEGPVQHAQHVNRKAWFESTGPNPQPNEYHQSAHQASNQPCQPSLEKGIDAVLELIREEAKLVERKCIFLGGFGQGFAMAAATFFADGEGDFGGLIGLNGWVPYTKDILAGDPSDVQLVHRSRAFYQPSNFAHLLRASPKMPPPEEEGPRPNTYGIIRRLADSDFLTPVFMSHSMDNDIVPYVQGYNSCMLINSMGFDILFEPYDVGTTNPKHGINEPHGITQLCQWIRQHFRSGMDSPEHRINGNTG